MDYQVPRSVALTGAAAYSGAVLALKPGQKVSDVLFRMTLAAVVTGRVNDGDSEPMLGVHITALRRLSDEEIEEQGSSGYMNREMVPVSMAETDDRGQYRLFGLKPGDY